MPRILLVGTATLDLVFGLEHYPGVDEEMRASMLRTCRGGNAANTAVVLAGLGHKPEFLGVLAHSPETAVIEDDLRTRGVQFKHCPRLPGMAPTSSIYLTGATRSIVHYRDLPELRAESLMSIDLGGFRWVHFEGRNVPQLLRMLHYVRTAAPHVKISVELEKPRDGIERVWDRADLLLCSSGYARHAGFDRPEDFLRWLYPQAGGAHIIVAWGESGAFGIDERALCHAPAQPPPKVVDTLGAGDTFNAGVLCGLLQGDALQAAMILGCRLAGHKCGMPGFSDLAR